MLARQGAGVARQSDELEEQGGAGDLAAAQIQIEDPHTTGDLGKLQKFGGFGHETFRLAGVGPLESYRPGGCRLEL
jgi:hypothetical protein